MINGLIILNLYKTIPEFNEQNYNMTLNEFKVIFWWEWGHRQLGRLIGLSVLMPLIFFSIKNGLWILKNYGLIFLLVCFQGFIGWYMVSSGLIDRVDVSHYRLSLHLVTAFVILSVIFWKFLKLTKIQSSIYFNQYKFNKVFSFFVIFAINNRGFCIRNGCWKSLQYLALDGHNLLS